MEWMFTFLTLFGTILAVYKKWQCFLIFSVSNIYWFIYDLRLGAYAQAAVFVGFTAVNIIGVRKWVKEKKEK